MILESLIHIVSVSLAIALLGTMFATFTYYARYKVNNRKKAPAPSHAMVEVALSTQAQIKPSVSVRKRLHFQSPNQSFKENVS